MNIDRWAGWVLVIGAFLLLAARGELELLVILLPLSLLLALGARHSRLHKTGLTDGMKKG